MTLKLKNLKGGKKKRTDYKLIGYRLLIIILTVCSIMAIFCIITNIDKL